MTSYTMPQHFRKQIKQQVQTQLEGWLHKPLKTPGVLRQKKQPSMGATETYHLLVAVNLDATHCCRKQAGMQASKLRAEG